MKNKKLTIASITAAVILTGCNSFLTKKTSSNSLLNNIDKTISPTNDFYAYANGKWLQRTKIPDDKSSYNSFSIIYKTVEKRLKDIIQQSTQSNSKQGTDQQKIGDLYQSYMDTKSIEKLGMNPIMPYLHRVWDIKDKPTLFNTLGYLSYQEINQPIALAISADDKNPNSNIVYILQSGLTLPNRDYYLKSEKKYQIIKNKMQEYIIELLQSVSYPNPTQAAKNILAFETKIANNQISAADSRDSVKNYNKRSTKEIEQLFGDFWPEYTKGLTLPPIDSAIVYHYPYMKTVHKLMQETSLQVWQDYLSFQIINHFTYQLPNKILNAGFEFKSKLLNGIPTLSERWRLAVKTTSNSLGELLGKRYVDLYFKPESKEKMLTLVKNLIEAYRSSINQLSWMTTATKQKALDKLNSIRTKIGYPDSWKDYSKVTIKKSDLIGNLQRINSFMQQETMAKLNKPVDKNEWHMSPQTINAYYNSTNNEIVFPAAILQPPFFNTHADDAMNYGGIGSIIGHELGHAFDDQGSKYDAQGTLNDWWSIEDRKKFTTLTAQLVAQYNQFEPLKNLKINGQLTLGENIGDLSGVTIAYKAYISSLQGKKPATISSLTGPQRFFLNYANIWKHKAREEYLRRTILQDPHSPPKYRVNGILPNVDAFYNAFDIKKDTPMYLDPKNRIHIW